MFSTPCTIKKQHILPLIDHWSTVSDETIFTSIISLKFDITNIEFNNCHQRPCNLSSIMVWLQLNTHHILLCIASRIDVLPSQFRFECQFTAAYLHSSTLRAGTEPNYPQRPWVSAWLHCGGGATRRCAEVQGLRGQNPNPSNVRP